MIQEKLSATTAWRKVTSRESDDHFCCFVNTARYDVMDICLFLSDRSCNEKDLLDLISAASCWLSQIILHIDSRRRNDHAVLLNGSKVAALRHSQSDVLLRKVLI